MAFLKQKWLLIVFALVCLASVGGTIWGIILGGAVKERIEAVDGIKSQVDRIGNAPANDMTIEHRRTTNARISQENAETEDGALAVQKTNPFYETIDDSGTLRAPPRTLLIKDVLPEPRTNAHAIGFRTEYIKQFSLLPIKLNARDCPTREEVQREEPFLASVNPEEAKKKWTPWSPENWAGIGEVEVSDEERTPLDILRDFAPAVAAYKRALGISMYLSNGAFGEHHLVNNDNAPSDVDIWQAQMSLWIQQDIATALARCNEKRAQSLRAAGKPTWVAHMPVKHLKSLAIANQLGSEIGPGGGSNTPMDPGFANSMTRINNNNDLFVVPLQLQLVVEAAALPSVLEELCSVGFYTPTSINYKSVAPNPTQVTYIYGSDPALDVILDLESYFFFKVYGGWIPKDLAEQKVLQTPNCLIEGATGRSGFGGRGRSRGRGRG